MKDEKSSASLRFENQICFPLYSAANAVVRAYTPLLEELDVTYLQYMVLMLLWEEKQLSVKALGEYLRLDSGTLTPLLKRLEVKGLVIRTRSEQDERVRLIGVTKKGLALQVKAQGIPEKLACSTGLSKSKGREFRSMCEQLLKALEA